MSYLIGAPLAHDGLSPTIRGYSRISTDENLIEGFGEEDCCCWGSTRVDSRLSSRDLTRRHDFKDVVWCFMMLVVTWFDGVVCFLLIFFL